MNRARIVVCFLILGHFFSTTAQNKEKAENSVYKIYPWIDIPTILTGFVTNSVGLNIVRSKGSISPDEIANLDPSSINSFDRRAIYQSYDSFSTAGKISDYGVNVTLALPLLLLLDKKIKSDWYKILLLFLEAQAIDANAYSWFAAIHIDRYRPLVYNPDFPIDVRTEGRNKNSFFSGHTSTTATASFFAAKVYSDYHPELGNKKYLLYGAALIPPSFVGYFRYKSSNHFPTDIITGIVVGAGFGILIPHIHKRKPKNNNTSIYPVVGSYSGLTLRYKFN